MLAPTTIKRFYHGTAMLLPDASILISGSEYGDCTEACARPTPWLFQHAAERFLPPYWFSGVPRPTITWKSGSLQRYGGLMDMDYTGSVDGAVLMAPASVTHQVHCGSLLSVCARHSYSPAVLHIAVVALLHCR